VIRCPDRFCQISNFRANSSAVYINCVDDKRAGKKDTRTYECYQASDLLENRCRIADYYAAQSASNYRQDEQ